MPQFTRAETRLFESSTNKSREGYNPSAFLSNHAYFLLPSLLKELR
jgi:hypothetical protein